MAVRVERDGAVSTVILDHPERRNAVDGPTAAALADAFRESAEGVARFRRGDGRGGALS
jgi:enoyl-CoA hydratase/carnithine racemase